MGFVNKFHIRPVMTCLWSKLQAQGTAEIRRVCPEFYTIYILYIYICIYICKSKYIYIYVYIYICKSKYIYIYIYICKSIYIYIYIYIIITDMGMGQNL